MKLSPFVTGLIIVLLAALLAGTYIFINRIQAGDAFTWEEASHGLYGVWIWRDINASDWGAFWYDTGRQMVWPFLHSWLLAIFFLDFGVSYMSARLLSLVLFLVSVVLVYGIANQLSERSGWKIGIMASALMLTSPLMVSFASENMIEALGALLFLAAAFLYTVCQRRRLIIHYVFLAIIIGLCVYTNYIYAYFIIPAFVVVTLAKLGPLVVEAVRLSRKGEKAAVPFIWWAYKKLVVMFILLVFAGVWFSFNFSRRIMLFMDTILRSGTAEGIGFLESLIYYPRIIIQQLSFSPWIGVFLLAALLLFYVSMRYRGMSKLFVFVWVTLILATLTVAAKTPQMIYIVVPFIFVIFSTAFVSVMEDLNKSSRKLAIGLVLVLLLPAMISLPRAYALYFPARSDQNLIDVLDYFKTEVPRGAEIGTILNLKRFNSEVIKFHFWDCDCNILTEDYQREGDVTGKNVYFLTLDLDKDSPYQKDVQDDSPYRWNAWLRDKEMKGEVRLYSTKRFESIGVTAKIFRNNPSYM
ncbi:glycosyltransferase family 39 protein [Candidatus Margulisiibacteriota bacterium]